MSFFQRYFDKRKHKIFPQITDWTLAHYKLRNDNNVKAMSMNQWFFFSPMNYRLVTYSNTILSMFVFVILAIWFYRMQVNTLTMICILFVLYYIVKLFEKIKKIKYLKIMNLYDLWMREYPEEKND